MTPEEFVKKYYPEAKKVEEETGFHYLITLAQGALESGWGKKALGNNFFGIKWTEGNKQDKQLITTTEYLSRSNVKFPEVIKVEKAGKLYKYTVKDWFRKYATPAEGFADHINFFLKNPRYAKALLVKDNPEKFFEEIAKAGYATAPDYAEQLKAMMHSVTKRL
jgi:flagellum-specific peptidoglycan hydrolase FlgJ